MSINVDSTSVTKLKKQLKAATVGTTDLMTRNQWTIGFNKTFKITLPDGQTFKSAPNFTNIWGDNKGTFDLSADKKSATYIYFSAINATYYLNIDANIDDGSTPTEPVEPEPPAEWKFKLTTTNITTLLRVYGKIEVNGIDVSKSKSTVLIANGELVKLYAKEKQLLTGQPYFNSPRTASRLFFKIADDKLTASVTYKQLDTSDESYNYSKIVASTAANSLLYTLKQSDIDNMNSQRVKMKVNSVDAVLGTQIYYMDEVTCSTSDPWHFVLTAQGKASAYFHYNSEYEYHLNMLDENNQNCGITMGAELLVGTVSSFNCETKQQVDTIASNEVFKVNDEIIKKVNAARFSFLFSQGESTTVFDYGNYILSLMKIPFNIPEELIGENQSIYLADKDMGVSAPVITTDLIKFSFGDIVIPKPENSLDYSNTVAILHLPRTSSITLNLDYVLGQTLNVTYCIDVYKGLATVNISSTKINSTIITQTVDIGINIPVANTALDAKLFNSNVNVGGDNGIYSPFIEIMSSNSELAKGFFSAPILVDGNLKEQYGLVRVSDIKLNSKALKAEKDTIISLLQSGVIINEPDN